MPDMKQRARVLSGIAVLVVASVLGAAGTAFAYQDSGVGSRGCPGKYGLLEVYQEGSGNSWAPGDWNSVTGGSPQWNGDTNYYRWLYDYQDNGYGGGSYRNVANADYLTLTPTCSAAG